MNTYIFVTEAFISKVRQQGSFFIEAALHLPLNCDIISDVSAAGLTQGSHLH